jgi:hypothetical protein
MRLVALIVVGAILTQLSFNTAHAQERAEPTQLEDPVFGLSYDYTKVHYDPLPASIGSSCRDLVKGGTYWIFAHTQRKSGDYYVVMGLVPGQSGDSLGVALWVRHSECSDEDSLWMQSGFIPSEGYSSKPYSGELPGLNAQQLCDRGECHYLFRSQEEEAILRDLVRDGISRGLRAWGEDRFKKTACEASWLKDKNSYTPIVQRELLEFCGRSK